MPHEPWALLLGMALLAVIAFIVLYFIDEVPLKTSIERDIVHGPSDVPSSEHG